MSKSIEKLCKEKVTQKDAEDGLAYLLSISASNPHLCLAYLLASKDQIVSAPESAWKRISLLFGTLKESLLGRCSPAWTDLITSSECTLEERKEENKRDSWIALVLETLIKTTTSEIERVVDEVLGSPAAEGGPDASDPRVPVSTKSISGEVLKEILRSLGSAPVEKSRRAFILPVVKMLSEEHIPVITRHLRGEVAKPFLLAVFIHRRSIYHALEKEALRSDSDLVRSLPRPNLDLLLSLLSRSPRALKHLEEVLRCRPIYQERVVEGISSYLRKGSRTRAVAFIRDNFPYFADALDGLGLSCEEVLTVAEKNPHLLAKVFVQIAEVKALLRERQGNVQKKEKRISALVSVLVAQLASADEACLAEFIKLSCAYDSDLLSRVCLTLFRAAPPTDRIKKVLYLLCAGAGAPSVSFVFMSIYYLEEREKLQFVGGYLVDDLSLSLFIRSVTPEKIFICAHFQEESICRRIVKLCLGRTETFTDRLVSSCITRLEESSSLPALFLWTVLEALEAFPNMKPFVTGLAKRVWRRVLGGEREERRRLSLLLERLEDAGADLLLSFPEEEIASITEDSEYLRQRTASTK